MFALAVWCFGLVGWLDWCDARVGVLVTLRSGFGRLGLRV